MQIGHYKLASRVVLAPMAGITDLPFRKICTQYGAGITFSEMMLANQKVWDTEKSKLRLSHDKNNGINAVQIAGNDPNEMEKAAINSVYHGAQIIDVNMGCPAKKVNRKMAGSALLQDLKLIEKILTAVVNAVDVPVTLKTRTGWNKQNKNCLDIAKIAENSGISALTIHGRTRECMFSGVAEYDVIKTVKQAVSIPIIANGDIISADKARFVLDYTKADAIMIGRGCLGNPWIFQEINASLAVTENNEPSLNDKCDVILKHINALHQFYGQEKGYRIARKHIAWYLQKLTPDSSHSIFNTINNASQQLLELEKHLDKICHNTV